MKQPDERTEFDRRVFVQASLTTAACALGGATATVAAEAPGPDIVDTNVHLFDWPFRRLKYARTDALAAKLRKHRITKAWAGSFEAVLQKQLDSVNRRLADECRTRGEFIPIGSVNPAWPDWEDDLRRCHETYHMPGVRLYPAYHGYALGDPETARLLAEAARRDLLVQIVLRLEDERVHHAAIAIAPVDLTPLPELARKLPKLRVQLLNAAGPLLGNNLPALVREPQITFDIAALEGNGGIGRVLEGKNYSYRGAVPVERLLFGSHAPYFPCESALMKLFESPLTLEQLEPLMSGNAQRLLKPAS